MSTNREKRTIRNMPAFRSCLFWPVWLAFALLSASGWLRMVQAIRDWYWLSFAQVEPGPLYLAITGGLWGLAGLVVVIWLWFWLPWSRLLGLGAALFFALTFWADRLLFSRAPGSQANVLFALLMTFLCLGVVLLALRPFEELRHFVKNNRLTVEWKNARAGKRSGQH